MAYLLEILGRGLLAELSAAFRDRLSDDAEPDTHRLDAYARQHPESAEAAFRCGVRALQQRLATKAQRFFQRTIAIAPQHIDALIGWACALDENGQLTDAIAKLRQARAIVSDDAAVLFALGFCLEKSGCSDEAESLYAEAIDISPQLRNAHERLSAIYLRNGNLDAAIIHCEHLCWCEPGNIDFSLTLANAYLRAGRNDESIQRFQFALTLDPDNWEAKQDVVSAFQQAGRIDEAIEQMELMIAQQPGFADNHLRLGDLFAQAGDTSRALRQYEQAVQINPDYLEARIKIGTALLRSGEFSEAAQAFNQAVELNDRMLTAYVGLGVAQMESGQPEEAEASIEMAAGVEPNSVLLFSEMARLQLKASAGRQVDNYVFAPSAESEPGSTAIAHTGEMIDEQIDRHRQALTQHPNYADLHYRLGLLLKSRGDLSAAIESFENAVAINPNYVKALIKLGIAYHERGDDQAAIAQFKKAMAIDPKVVDLYYQLGLIFADRAQFALAVEQFEHAIRLEPANVELHANLALCLQDMGLIDRADACWQTLCEIAPQSEKGRNILATVDKRD